MKSLYTERLFIYGTLALEDIQLSLFKRSVPITKATLKNYRKSHIRLPDIPEGTVYPILSFTGNPDDIIEGHILMITQDELSLADAYEGYAYRRERVLLESGVKAWCYITN